MGPEVGCGHFQNSPERGSRLSKAWWFTTLAFLLIVGGVVVRGQVFLRSLIGRAKGVLTLPAGERILVLAPHPDDEVLGCGGLLQAALAQGDAVWVAWMTCGDAPWWAADEVDKKLRPRPQDYLNLGRRRREEAWAAAKTLGIPADHLFFLGYPDQGLVPLWQTYWERPFRSPHTRVAAVPYGKNRHPYTGQQVLTDLVDLLGVLQPTCIFVAHPNDAHPDHWATSAFLLSAREVWALTQEAPFPKVYTYLVHRREWPRPSGYHPGLALEPPATLAQEGHRWLIFPLTQPQILGKAQALEAHRSQMRLSKTYLHSFVRSNELFEQLTYPPSDFSSHFWREGENISPVASTDAPTIKFLPGAEINAIEIWADEHWWHLRISLGRHPFPLFDLHLTYRLFLHSLGRTGEALVHRKALVQLPADSAASAKLQAITALLGPPLGERLIPCRRLQEGWEVQIPRSWFAPSQVLLYGAEVRWRHHIIDRTSLSCWRNPGPELHSETPPPAREAAIPQSAFR